MLNIEPKPVQLFSHKFMLSLFEDERTAILEEDEEKDEEDENKEKYDEKEINKKFKILINNL